MTYLVMENHLSYSVVLDEAGRFLKVANRGFGVGETVDKVLPLPDRVKKTVTLRLISAVGGLAACLALAFSFYWNQYLAPFASIYLSINPEVRMEINRRDDVVGLYGVNEDGASLIDGYSFKEKAITQVADDLVDRAIDMGFLSDGGMVTVNIDAPDEEWFADTGVTLRQNLNEHLSERMSVTIEIKQYTQETQAAVGEEPSESPRQFAGPPEPELPPSSRPESAPEPSSIAESTPPPSSSSKSPPPESISQPKPASPPPSSSRSESRPAPSSRPAQSEDSSYNSPASDDDDSSYSPSSNDSGYASSRSDSSYGGRNNNNDDDDNDNDNDDDDDDDDKDNDD